MDITVVTTKLPSHRVIPLLYEGVTTTIFSILTCKE